MICGNSSSDLKTQEVKNAKMTEINNLIDHGVFEEVIDEGQETLGSRWVMTAKEKHDGQKQKTKAKLVVGGYQEATNPQSDSPTISKESFKMLMAVTANESFGLALVDIRAAFLQSRTLDRDVFMLPPQEATIWLIQCLWKVLASSKRSFETDWIEGNGRG